MPKNHYKPGTEVLVRGIIVGEYNPDNDNASVSVRFNTHMDYGRNVLFSLDKLEAIKPAFVAPTRVRELKPWKSAASLRNSASHPHGCVN